MSWLVSVFVRCSWVLFIFLFVPIMAQSVLSQGVSDNAPPQFVGSTNLTLEEHGVLNHTLTVEDADPGDSVTGYEFGGLDASYFFFNESTGVLSMNISPDFERPVDSDGDNLYEVDVRAYSGTGGRKLNSSAVFTVNVTDKLGEVPGPPGMLVESVGFDSLTFHWRSPAVNTGPGVNRYQAQTLRGSRVTYSKYFPRPQTITLGGGARNTSYVARARAENADGWGPWVVLPTIWTDDCDNRISGNTCSLSLGVNGTGRINAHYFRGGDRNRWDHDWFSVDLEAGVEYQIDVKGNESTDLGGTLDDPIVKLFNQSGGAIDGTEDDNGGYGKNARMSYTPEVNGTYYVDVSSITPQGYSSGEGKTYTVFVKGYVRPSNVVATGRVGILGKAWRWATLTADTSGINDGNGLVNASFRYQWIRVDGSAEEYISGATERTYTPVVADVGKKLKVVVIFTDDDFYSEGPLVSDPTDLVYHGGFNVSSGARNFWSDGKILYFTKDTFNLHAYNMSSGSRVTGKEFSVNYRSARGLWSDGNILWVSQPDLRIIQARELSGGSTVSSGSFLSQDLTQGNLITSIHSTGATMWVLMGDYKQIYAYDRSSKIRDSGRTINLSALSTPRSIWSDGEVMWVSDGSGSVFAYTISSGARDFDKDLNLSEFSAQAIWSDGEVMWVGSPTGGVVRTYAIDTNPGFLSGVLRDVGNENPKGVWSDGVFMWVLDKDDKKVYAYRISDKSRVSYLDFGTLDAAGNDNPYAIWSDGVTMWVSDLDDRMLYAYKMSDKSRDSGKDFDLGSGSVPRGIWSDETTLWVVNSSASDEILAFKMSDKSRDSGKDFTGLNSAGVGDPEGIWSDGHTMFVLDSADQKVYAFNVGDKSRVSGNDFDLASGNGGGGGIWSHGGTMWVTDAVDDMIYAYSLPDSVVVPVNNLPVFSSSSSFSVNENSVDVGAVVASDGDDADSVTGYSVSGGVDRNSFSITNDGELTFNSPPDYENPVDSGGNNVYNLIITATSGTGSRVLTAIQSITVTVQDVVEVPSAPSAPTLSSPNSTSLSVSWSAPLNTGPAISDYDVGYGLSSGGSFIDWPHSGSSTTATITGLNASTLYFVRVRAVNVEGSSGWSPTASFTTRSTSPPLLTNASKLVSNLDQDNSNRRPISDNYNRASAQKFGVGSTSVLEKIVMPIATFSGSPNVSVSIHHVGSDSNPGDKLYSLTGNVSSTDTWDFAAPANALLNASEYFLVFRMQGGSGSFSVTSTFSTAEDSGAADGWSIGNVHYITYDGRSWLTPAVGTDRFNLRFAVYGEVRGTVVNHPPVFSSGSNFSVNENNRAIGTVVASDSDGADNVTGYRISGGFNDGRFSITSGGVFTFRSAPNFESPYSGNNVYDMIVTATSGTGGRVRTTVQGVTVTVVDVVEVPSAPGRPVLGSSSSTSLLVSWSVPSNTGPSISGYDVEYRQGTSGSFSGWSHSGTGTSATITGLSASTSYQVQVRAVNDEGNSSWSPTASFTTRSVSPSLVTNNVPVFSSGSSFSVSENVRSVGTVVASDSDSQDSVTGYSVSGGLDSARFSITTAGVLTFNSAPDYENPVDSGGNNVYNLIVTATSGTGSRELSATQSIVVTVVDVSEGGPPPAPVNNPPVFTSSSTFSISENAVSVGTVVASDTDNQDGVNGYRISSGVDSARFSITNRGVLTFRSAPDYESPADSGGDNVYDLVVTVTSGVGGRVRIATQSITVTVNDMAEGGGGLVNQSNEVVLVYRCV